MSRISNCLNNKKEVTMTKETLIKNMEQDIAMGKSAEELYIKYIKPISKMSQKRDLLLNIIKRTTEDYVKDIEYLTELNKGE